MSGRKQRFQHIKIKEENSPDADRISLDPVSRLLLIAQFQLIGIQLRDHRLQIRKDRISADLTGLHQILHRCRFSRYHNLTDNDLRPFRRSKHIRFVRFFLFQQFFQRFSFFFLTGLDLPTDYLYRLSAFHFKPSVCFLQFVIDCPGRN